MNNDKYTGLIGIMDLKYDELVIGRTYGQGGRYRMIYLGPAEHNFTLDTSEPYNDILKEYEHKTYVMRYKFKKEHAFLYIDNNDICYHTNTGKKTWWVYSDIDKSLDEVNRYRIGAGLHKLGVKPNLNVHKLYHHVTFVTPVERKLWDNMYFISPDEQAMFVYVVQTVQNDMKEPIYVLSQIYELDTENRCIVLQRFKQEFSSLAPTYLMENLLQMYQGFTHTNGYKNGSYLGIQLTDGRNIATGIF